MIVQDYLHVLHVVPDDEIWGLTKETTRSFTAQLYWNLVLTDDWQSMMRYTERCVNECLRDELSIISITVL